MVVRGAEKNLPFPYVIPAQYEYYFYTTCNDQ